MNHYLNIPNPTWQNEGIPSQYEARDWFLKEFVSSIERFKIDGFHSEAAELMQTILRA